MIDASIQTAVRSDPILPLTTRLGPVRIAVTDRERALAVWRDVVGLDLIEENGNVLSLGAGGAALIVLETGAAGPAAPRSLGLYHVALHVPKRADLAQFVLRALQQQMRIAPTDHLVSEAVYLWDHDGNGVEMTFETPWRGRLGDPEQGAYAIAADGRPHSGREPIDIEGLLAELGNNPAVEPHLPAGTRIGHMHVHVGDLDAAMRFYRDVIGFGGFMLIRSFGMGDVGLDYMPHTIAFNIWSGANARQAPEGMAGLRWFTVVVPDAETLADMRRRVENAGGAATMVENGFAIRDPAGNLVHIVSA